MKKMELEKMIEIRKKSQYGSVEFFVINFLIDTLIGSQPDYCSCYEYYAGIHIDKKWVTEYNVMDCFENIVNLWQAYRLVTQ